MARLVFDGLELQDLAAGYWFEVIAGGPDDVGEWIGEDDEVMGASGRAAGEWLADTRPLRMHGVVFGDGATPALVRVSYRTRMAALVAKMSPAATKAIVAHPPNFGLSAGTTATLSDVRPERIIGPTAGGASLREMTLELRCIDSPPDWVIA